MPKKFTFIEFSLKLIDLILMSNFLQSFHTPLY